MIFNPKIFWLSGIVILSLTTNMHAGTIQKSDKVTTTTSGQTSPTVGLRNEASGKADGWTLYAEQWDIARSGETVLSLGVLNKVVNAWLQDKGKTIEVQYPGGEEGEFWVQELTDWMVSLAIPSDSIQTVPGSAADDIIRFQLSRR
jgi:hypothetical protein